MALQELDGFRSFEAFQRENLCRSPTNTGLVNLSSFSLEVPNSNFPVQLGVTLSQNVGSSAKHI